MRDKINDWTDPRRVFVGNFQGTDIRPGKKWKLRNYKQQLGESLCEYYDASPSAAPSSPARQTTTPSWC
jgi:hypothetical protein